MRLFIMILGLSCTILGGCGGGDSGGQAVTEKTDSSLYVSGTIQPANFLTSTIGSHIYNASFSIEDVSSGTSVPVSDATVSINGQVIPYNSTSGYYVLSALDGSYSTGSTFTVTISHPRVALTRTLTVPATTVPAMYDFSPAFDNGNNKTVQNVSYTVTPTSSWTNYGVVVAYLYETGTTSPVTGKGLLSLTTGATFSTAMLSYGSPAVLSQNISFGAWNMDKIDLQGFSSTNINRLRVMAPSGTPIAQNF